MQNKFVRGILVLAVGDMTHVHVHFCCPVQYVKCTESVTKGLLFVKCIVLL